MFRHFRMKDLCQRDPADAEGYGGIVVADRVRRFTAAAGGGKGGDGDK